ncbi:uncharacterized oxidoreductase [[Candida] jaroonii]|uniref:Uncharacterized oxidoreductase n=1 Tax=[Candida] jaroonii TaxID=467808 RepID=A0ACA9YGE3_9ASCO|nr:uncharacterized oxidoreductase [[Candida] jaroonii]
MKTYLITGANRGIGLGLVTELVKNPDNKVLVTVRKSANIEALEALGSNNLQIFYCDIAVEKEMDQAFEEITKKVDSIDIAILNAAYIDGNMKSPLELTESQESWKEFTTGTTKSIEINAYSQIYLTNKLIPLVEKSQEKKIIFISTSFGNDEFIERSRIDNVLPYSLSKSMTNTIVAKYTNIAKQKKMTIIALCPGIVNSNGLSDEIMAGFIEGFKAGFLRNNEDFVGIQTVEQACKKFLKAVEFYGPIQSGKLFSTNGSEHMSA